MAEKLLNINLEKSRRKRFTIDGDENRILELNPSDLGIFARIDNFDKVVTAAIREFGEKQVDSDDDNFDVTKLGEAFTALDKLIREQLDILYDTNFSEVTTPHGTMVDPIEGEFRFQYLNDVFAELYQDQITQELKERNDKIREHTKKYVDKVNKE